MIIYVNGSEREIAENSTVFDVVTKLELQGKKIAIELNQEILPFQSFETHSLQANDKLEIVHAIGGLTEMLNGKGKVAGLFGDAGLVRDVA